MFGYVTTNMEEMKIKDYRIYHGFYCGVCQDLKEDHGQSGKNTSVPCIRSKNISV